MATLVKTHHDLIWPSKSLSSTKKETAWNEVEQPCKMVKIVLKNMKNILKKLGFQFLFPDPNPSLLHPPRTWASAMPAMPSASSASSSNVMDLSSRLSGVTWQVRSMYPEWAQKPWEDAVKIMENPWERYENHMKMIENHGKMMEDAV